MHESSSNESFYSAEEEFTNIDYVSFNENGITWTIPMVFCSYLRPMNRNADLWEFFVLQLLQKNYYDYEDMALLTS